MTSAQKIIKYLAIAFACILAFNIFYGIYLGSSAILSIFDNDNKTQDVIDVKEYSKETSILNIDIAAAKLNVKLGDTLKVESNNKYINVTQTDNKLSVAETNHHSFNKKSEITIYITKDMVFDKVILNTGAGSIEIESLSAEVLDLDIGAGKLVINELIVTDKADIESGAGEVLINNGNINNLNLDAGVGKFTLNSILTGSSDIDAGVGALNINLLDGKENYTISAEKGLGSLTIAGEKYVKEATIGTGKNKIDIDGGVGSVVVNFR